MKNILTILVCSLLAFRLCAQPIELSTSQGSIYGTLLMPSTSGQVPVALIIAGSGPTDRDGNNTAMKNNSLKMLADSLKAHGIASLRYDKRGIAESKDAVLDESELRFGNYVDDAVAWVKLLKEENWFSKIFIIGHSEGSLIGMIAAENSPVDGFISVAGAGFKAGDLIKTQLAGQPEAIKNICYSIIDSLEAGKTVPDVDPVYYSLFRPSVQPYMISWFNYDPCKEIPKLSMPVLIVQGTTDIQVSVKDAENLKRAKPDAAISIIEGMNHIMKNAPADRQENIATYSDPALPLNEAFVKTLVGFIENSN